MDVKMHSWVQKIVTVAGSWTDPQGQDVGPSVLFDHERQTLRGADVPDRCSRSV